MKNIIIRQQKKAKKITKAELLSSNQDTQRHFFPFPLHKTHVCEVDRNFKDALQIVKVQINSFFLSANHEYSINIEQNI